MLNSDLLSFEKSPLFIPTFSALQDFLTFAGIFDLKSNQVNILFAPNDFSIQSTQSCNSSEILEKFISSIEINFQSHARKFLDFSKHAALLKKKKYLSCDIKDKKGSWFRILIANAEKNEADESVKIFLAVQPINSIKKAELESKKKEIEYSRLKDILSSDFNAAYIIDLDNDTYEIKILNKAINAASMPIFKTFTEFANSYINTYILPEYQKEIRNIFNIENLKTFFRTRQDLHFRYKTVPNKNGETNFEVHFTSLAEREGNLAVGAFRCIDEAVAREEELREKLKKAPSRQDYILSKITQQIFSFNISVFLETGKYSLLAGKGMEKTLEILRKNNDLAEIQKQLHSYIHPAYKDKIETLANIENLRNDSQKFGFLGALEYPILFPGEVKYQWHELNVFRTLDDDNRVLVNILGRDITEQHNRQEEKERQQREMVSKNQLIAELTKMIYSYNLTLNLYSGKFSLLIGNGTTIGLDILKSTDSYEEAFSKKIKLILPEALDDYINFLSFDAIKAKKDKNGFIGLHEFPAKGSHGIEWTEVNVFISTNKDGEPIANILGRDITEQHRRQEEKENARQAELAQSQLLSNITKMLYGFYATVNLSTWKYTIVSGSSFFYPMNLARQTDDFILSFAQIKKYILPEYRQDFENLIGIDSLQKVKDRRGFIGTITTAADKDGRTYWQEFNLFISVNKFGEAEANILGRDITAQQEEREQHSKELKASLAKELMLTEVTKMLYIFNISINTQTLKFTYTLDKNSPLNRNSSLKSNDYEVFYEECKKFVCESSQKDLELHLSPEKIRSYASKTGFIGSTKYACSFENRISWVEINIFSLVNSKGMPIITLLGRNVTEAHEKANTEAQLKIAQAANETKSKVLSNLSHDIRTPINGIMGMLKIAERYRNNQKKIDDCLKKIDISANHLLTLLNDSLELNRLENGRIVFDNDSFEIKALINEIDMIIRPTADDASITLTTKNISGKCPRIFASSLHIRQIMMNILSNAVKYNKKNGKIDFTVTQTHLDSENVSYRFVIKDNGIGMSSEFQSRMFDSFEQENIEDCTVRSKYKGYGLGLAIVRQLVNQMNGKISVESKKNVGTTFTIDLSFKIDNAESDSGRNSQDSAQGRKTEEVFNENTNLDSVKILLVEDNELNMEIAVELLTEEGAEVKKAFNGKEAVDIFKNSKQGEFDIILMDIMMPVMNGIEATMAIRKLEHPDAPKIPILAMTANAFSEDIAKCLQAGMNEHIAKPIQIEKLKKSILKFVR